MTQRSEECAHAKAQGLKRYFTGKPCARGHLAERYCSSQSCVECARENQRGYIAADSEKFAQRCKNWRDANKEAVRSIHARYRAENLEACKERCRVTAKRHRLANGANCAAAVRAWALANPEKIKAIRAAWLAKHPEWMRAHLARRRAALKKAMPKWADRNKIRTIYAQAVRATVTTGVPHHVDHEIPLVSPIVCGLHVETNLRVVTAELNHKKSNRFSPELA